MKPSLILLALTVLAACSNPAYRGHTTEEVGNIDKKDLEGALTKGIQGVDI